MKINTLDCILKLHPDLPDFILLSNKAFALDVELNCTCESSIGIYVGGTSKRMALQITNICYCWLTWLSTFVLGGFVYHEIHVFISIRIHYQSKT